MTGGDPHVNLQMYSLCICILLVCYERGYQDGAKVLCEIDTLSCLVHVIVILNKQALIYNKLPGIQIHGPTCQIILHCHVSSYSLPLYSNTVLVKSHATK